YVKGRKSLAEDRMNIPTAASSSTASHIQDCWETSTGARKTVTARVVPSTSTRAITAGTVTDRVRCAGAWDELMGRLCLSGRWGTEGRRAAAPRGIGAGVPGRTGTAAPSGIGRSADLGRDLLTGGGHRGMGVRPADDVSLCDAQRSPDGGHRRDGGHRIGGLGEL